MRYDDFFCVINAWKVGLSKLVGSFCLPLLFWWQCDSNKTDKKLSVPNSRPQHTQRSSLLFSFFVSFAKKERHILLFRFERTHFWPPETLQLWSCATRRTHSVREHKVGEPRDFERATMFSGSASTCSFDSSTDCCTSSSSTSSFSSSTTSTCNSLSEKLAEFDQGE